jgi:hypothetical protein
MPTSLIGKALEAAGGITHPISAAVFAVVFACFAFTFALKHKKTRIAWLLAAGLLILGLAPLASSTFLASRGLYRIRLTVLDPDGQPVPQAIVTSSAGGEIEKSANGWEISLPPQSVPTNRKLTLFASINDAYLAGSSDLLLASNYYLGATIKLQPLPPVEVRGVVLDEKNHSVSGADVSIQGNHEIASTDAMGNFTLPAHASKGEMVTLRAQKGELVAQAMAVAGQSAELTLRKP